MTQPAGGGDARATTYALVRLRPRSQQLDLDTFARASGLHPDVLRRMVALGLLDASRDAAGDLWFEASQLAACARLQRLRAGFALNYAALGLVTDLLDRIAELEGALRNRSRRTGG